MFKEKIQPEGEVINEDKRLSLKEAQDEANMIRGKLRETALKEGYSMDFEDDEQSYDWGEKFISELKEAAKNEPELVKSAYRLGRIFHNIGRAVGAPVAVIDQLLATWVTALVTHGRGTWGYDQKQRERDGKTFTTGILAPSLEDIDKFISEDLTDKVKELSNHKRLGRQFARQEKKKDQRLERYKELKEEFEPRD